MWHILHSSQLISMGDEFVEGPFRVILRGATLAVNIEGCSATIEVVNRAEGLAKSYIDNLRRNLGEPLHLVTEEEFLSLPPWASQNQAAADFALRQRSSHVERNPRQALRDARHSVISYTWPLKECYDYMQDAVDELFFPKIYKMIETMKNHLGGWGALRKKTGLAAEVNFLKKVADEGRRDERHAPKDRDATAAPHWRGARQDPRLRESNPTEVRGALSLRGPGRLNVQAPGGGKSWVPVETSCRAPMPCKNSRRAFWLPEEVIKMDQKCRVCGCTDDDCSECIAAQGHPCHWVEEDLCSRCSGRPQQQPGYPAWRLELSAR